MKKSTSSVLTAGFLFLAVAGLKAQIGINNTSANPDPSAILDLQSGNAGVNKGFLPQAVALTNVTVAAPVVAPATGLIVYSSTAPTGGTGVGYYYWSGSSWLSMGGSGALANLTQGTGITSFTYNGSSAATVGIANTAVTAGNYGSATMVPTYTVNAQGQLTGAANVAISASGIGAVTGSGTINYLARWTPSTTNLGIGVVQDNGTTVGINNAPVAGTMLSVSGGSTNSGISATTTYTLAGSSAVHGNDTIGIDGYLGYSGSTTIAGFSFTKAGGYFAGTAGKCAPFAATSSGTNPNVAVMGLSNNWHGGFFVTANGQATGVVGYNDSVTNKSGGNGVYGITGQTNGFGVIGQNVSTKHGRGIGVMGIGSQATGNFFEVGEGVMGNGTTTGVIGYADSAAKTCAGGYFQNTASFAYVGYTLAATNYKINGNGSVATIVKDQNNNNINLFCPEAPEILFQDYGQGQLVSGKTHINLDPNYAKNVTVNEKHALRVIITMNDPCPNTIYVTNRTATGFDVIENNNGTSNASFTYEVIANRADEVNMDGSIAKNADVRFPAGPSAKTIVKANHDNKTVLSIANNNMSGTK